MTSITPSLRRLVIERSGKCCEYCLQSQDERLLPFHIEHIIAQRHGGQTTESNLCLSCPTCNTLKGSDIGSIDPQTGSFTRLFNPRIDQWTDHFQLNDSHISPLTSEGRVTEFLLQFNDPKRLEERALMIEFALYPCR